MADVPGKFYRATKVRTGVSPSSAGSIEGEPLPPVNPPGSSLNSVGLTMPSAFTVSNSPLTANGTIGVAGAGTVSQYIRGDGSLADFPESSGGGGAVSYYLNGSVAQGTIGGIAYKELSKVPILGAGTDFTINADGYIASFITDAGDPNLLEIPGGNWNFETYFSASSGGGSPTFYVELYKVNAGGTATLIASSSTSPELIAFGTNLTPYFSSLAVPTTTLALTDRLAVRYYVTHSGRTITLHTENNHLCQIITTFTTGLTALNGLTAQVQNFAVGTTGTDFNIASATATHTFNLPTASATNRGALSSADWALFTQAYNDKINSAAVTGTTTKTLTLTQQDGGTITASWSDLNTDAVLSVFGRTGNVIAVSGDYTTAQVTESGNLYYTDARSRAALSFAAGSGAYNTSTGVITIPTNNNQITNGAGYITSAALSGYVQGSASAGQVAYWSSGSAITGESNLFWDSTNDRLGIGNANPNEKLEVSGAISATGTATTAFASSSTLDYLSGGTRLISRGGNNSTRGTFTLKIEASDGSLSINPLVINNTGATTFSNLAGSGTRMVVADTNGLLSTQAISGGTVTSVTASSPLASSGGTTPNITIQQASGSQSGFLSSTDWTTFNSKQNALTNPVTGTGTTNYLPKFTGSTTIGNSLVFDDGTNVGIGTITPGSKFDVTNTVGTAYDASNTLVSGQTMRIANTSTSSSIASTLLFIATGGGGGNGLGTISGVNTATGSLALTFGTRDSGGSVTERARITSGGNLLVGTTSNNGAKLQVSGGNLTVTVADTPQVLLTHSNTSRTFLMAVDGGNAFFRANSSNNILFQVNGGDTALTLASNRAATFSSSVTASQFIVGSATTSSDVSVRYKTDTGDFSTINERNTHSFGIYDNQVSLYRLYINSSGNVGIGTPSPSANALLHLVQNTSNLNLYLQNTNGSGKTWALNSDLNGRFNIHDTAANRLTISTEGNVLIGLAGNNGGILRAKDLTNRYIIAFEKWNSTLTLGGFFQNSGSSGEMILVDTNGSQNVLISSSGNSYWNAPSARFSIGTTVNTTDLFRVNGSTYTNTIMTWNPENDNRSGIAWRLGAASIGAITPNRRLRVNVGGVEYYIGAVEV